MIMTNIAIIPARGGSQRVPRKNVLPLLGRPMICHSIKAAWDSGIFERVIVSTEDDEIAQIAENCGAEVFARPEELATSEVGVDPVILHVLETLKIKGDLSDYFCCLYATAAFVRSDDLVASRELLRDDSMVVMGVSEYNLRVCQALIEENGFLKIMWPEYSGLQSQGQPHFVASNGTLYWSGCEAFLKNKTFYTDKLKGYLIPKNRHVDIDDPDDYKLACLLAPHLLKPDSNTPNR